MARLRLIVGVVIKKNINPDKKVKIGFVALVDCAPLAVAYEKGWFSDAGVDVELLREPGWASIRDKIVYGEIDAAHAPIGLCFGITWGLGGLRCPCQTGFLFNSNGDSITVSTRITEQQNTFGSSDTKLKFAIPHLFSSHHFLLNQWLKPYGGKAGVDYEIVVLPPSLMVPSLEDNYIDGFCVGEPFGSIAANRKVGTIVKESADLSPLHPEKALLVTDEFAKIREDEHLRIIAALIRAAEYCDTKDGRLEASKILSQDSYLAMDASVIEQSLFQGVDSMQSEDFHLFNRLGVNEPTSEKANWVVSNMRLANLIPDSLPVSEIQNHEIFRNDTYQRAIKLDQSFKKKTIDWSKEPQPISV